MEILLWLVPPVAVTLVAMAWVSWLGRAGRGHIGHEEALRRLGAALERESPLAEPLPRRPREPSTGVALRRRDVASEPPAPVPETDGAVDGQRRAS